MTKERWTKLEGKARREWMDRCGDAVAGWKHYFAHLIANGTYYNSLCGLNPLVSATEQYAYATLGLKDEAAFKLMVKHVANARAGMVEKGIPLAKIWRAPLSVARAKKAA